MPKVLNEKKILIVILALSFIIFVTGICWGLPYGAWQPDHLVGKALKIVSEKTLDTDDFTRSPFSIYLYAVPLIPYGAYLVLTKQLPTGISTIYDAPDSFFTTVFVLARLWSVLFGLGVVFMVYLLAKKIFSKNAGFFAAGFAAVTMAIATQAHFEIDSISATFFTLTALYFSVCLISDPSKRNYFLSSLFFALAVATKNITFIFVPSLAIAAFLSMKNSKITLSKTLKRLILSGLFMICLYFALNPYSLINYEDFIAQSTWSASVRTEGFNGDVFPGIALPYYVSVLINGFGVPLFVLVICAFVYWIFKIPNDKTKQPLYIIYYCIFIFLLYYGTWHYMNQRYILQVMALLVVLAGGVAAKMISVKKTALKKLAVAVLIIIFAYSLIYVAVNDMVFLNDSRYSEIKWINGNIPKNETLNIIYGNQFALPGKSMGYAVISYELDAFKNKNTDVDGARFKQFIQNNVSQMKGYLFISSYEYGKFIDTPDTFLSGNMGAGNKSTDTVRRQFYLDLFDGKYPFVEVARFKYVPSLSFLFNPIPEHVNPEIIVYKRT